MKALVLSLAFAATATAAYADGELTCFYNSNGEFTYTADGPSAPDGTFDFAYSFILSDGAWYDESACPMAIGIPPLVRPGPDFTLDPAFGRVDLAAGFLPDPHQVDILAGGTYDASISIDPACRGWIAAAPDYRLTFTASSNPRLTILVESAADTTLVINDPQGIWHCNDDSNSFDPAIAFSTPLSGQYDIWVGTFGGAGIYPAATLMITEY